MSRKSGDILEGPPGIDPTTSDQYARKGYVDNKVADAANLTTGTVDKARLPFPATQARTVSPSSGVININASTYGSTVKNTIASSATLAVPTNGSEDMVIEGIVYCNSSSALTLTLASGFQRLSSVSSSLSIPAGKYARYTLRFCSIASTTFWLVELLQASA
jgi:hypothetical protein